MRVNEKRFVLSKQQDDFKVKIIFKNQLDFDFFASRFSSH